MKSIIIALAASTCMAVQLKTNQDMMAPAEFYDRDGDGNLNWREFDFIMGGHLKQKGMTPMMALWMLADKDHDLLVTLDEFKAFE